MNESKHPTDKDLKHEIDEFHSYVLKLPQKKIFLYAKYPEETIEIPAD